jgi:hypothetical protein
MASIIATVLIYLIDRWPPTHSEVGRATPFLTTVEWTRLLAALGLTGIVLSPFTVFPAFIVTHTVLRLCAFRNTLSRALIGGVVGAVVAGGVSMTLPQPFFRPWLFLGLSIIPGTIIGVGWGLVAQPAAEEDALR